MIDRGNKRGIIVSSESGLSISLYILFFYSFYYQYAFGSVPVLFPVLGCIILALSIHKTKLGGAFLHPLFSIILFTVYVVICGMISSYNRTYTISYTANYLEYQIPLFGIYCYCKGDLGKLRRIILGIWASITLLAIHALFIGTTSINGAITVEGQYILNPNTFSSLLSLGLLTGVILLCEERTSWWKILLILSSIIIQFVAQVNCASRRGVLVFIFFGVIAGYIIEKEKLKNKYVSRFLVVLILISGLVLLASYSDYIETLLVFQRFRNTDYQGDLMRSAYRTAAIDLFRRNPIIGKGFGAVTAYAGSYSHSMYYELLACTGIIGTFIFLAVVIIKKLVIFVKATKKLAFHDLELKLVCEVICLFIISILVSGIAVVYIYDMFFYIMLGVIISFEEIIRKRLIEKQ